MSLAPWLQQKIIEEFGLKAAETAALMEAVASVAKRRGVDCDELCRIALQDFLLRREVAAEMSVGESFFFRHAEHEEAIRNQVRSVLSRGRRARIWSAGCSRGEEPFSVAMLLIAHFGRGVRAAAEIEANDINASSLACGKSGLFGAWSLRGVDETVRERFFERSSSGFRIQEELRAWVRFSHASVQAQFIEFPPASVDLILFRNVGIYLTPEALAFIHEGFARVLAPDGLLLQAATDPAPQQGSVLKRWTEGPFGSYRAQAARVTASSAEKPRKTTSRRTPSFARSGPWPRTAMTSGEQPIAKDDEPQADTAGLSISRASALADAGRVQEAVSHVDQLIARHPRQRAAYVLRAQLRLHQHDCEGAVEDLRRALFLDPGDCLARYWYSVSLTEAGRLKEAEAQRRVLASHLAGRDGSDRLSDGETTVEELRALMPGAATEQA